MPLGRAVENLRATQRRGLISIFCKRLPQHRMRFHWFFGRASDRNFQCLAHSMVLPRFSMLKTDDNDVAMLINVPQPALLVRKLNEHDLLGERHSDTICGELPGQWAWFCRAD